MAIQKIFLINNYLNSHHPIKTTIFTRFTSNSTTNTLTKYNLIPQYFASSLKTTIAIEILNKLGVTAKIISIIILFL